MSESSPAACQFCGRPATDPVAGDYCSPGCHSVATTLEQGPQPRAEQTAEEAGQDSERAFFHVAGMHSATCEAFLEAAAEACDGVTGAEASYVTETIRVEYDPARIESASIKDSLRVAGYRAVSREETSSESTATVLAGESGQSARALEDLLGFRYAAGVVFGTFMLLPYIVVFYPAHLTELLGVSSQVFSAGLGSGAYLLAPLFVGVTGIVVFFTGLPLLRGAYVSLRMRRPNTDLLAVLTIFTAYLYSIGTLFLGRLDIYFDLTIVVSASVVAAIFYESLVKQQAMEQLTDLTISQTDEARFADEDRTVPVEALQPGDRVLVRQGERIPVDGVLAEGTCTVDESVVTGESLPIHKQVGDDLVGGAVVTDSVAVLRVGDPPTSSIDRITTAVWLLRSATHGLQRATDRVAARVMPVLAVVAMVAAVASVVLGGGPVAAPLALLTVVLVACPWGLALSTPLSVATNIQAAMERGIVVFDETVFERLRATDVVVLDKTGTLTTGEMRVTSTDAGEDLLVAAATLERYASHPAAEAITDSFSHEGENGVAADGGTDNRVADFENHGLGVQGTVDGTPYLVGHPDLFAEQGWPVDEDIDRQVQEARQAGQLPVVLGREGQAEGVVVLGDRPREGWEAVVSDLAQRDVDVVVLTGDDAEAAATFRDHPGVAHAFAGIPPSGKTETIRRLQADNHVTMVGDGTNDAPALARADLGIALGSGTALASDAADVAIADDDLGRVETTFALARAARRRVRQNTGLALLYNVVAIPAAAVGFVNPLVVMGGAVLSGGLLAVNAHRQLLA